MKIKELDSNYFINNLETPIVSMCFNHIHFNRLSDKIIIADKKQMCYSYNELFMMTSSYYDLPDIIYYPYLTSSGYMISEVKKEIDSDGFISAEYLKIYLNGLFLTSYKNAMKVGKKMFDTRASIISNILNKQ